MNAITKNETEGVDYTIDTLKLEYRSQNSL